MKTESGRRAAAIEPPSGAPLMRVKMLETIDEGELKEAVELQFDSSAEDVEDQWVETARKVKVRLWGCSAILTGTHCTAMAMHGEWFVTKACC